MSQLQSVIANQTGLLLALGIGLAVLAILSPKQHYKGKKVFNDRKGMEWLYTNAKIRFVNHGRNMFKAAFEQSQNAFYIVTSRGVEMILSHKYIPEIRNDDRFNFPLRIEQLLHGRINGFEMFKQSPLENKLFIDTFQSRMTREIGQFLLPISQEIEHFLQTRWTDNSEWHAFSLYPSIVDLIAQGSSRLFVGPNLCRDPDWLRVTVSYNANFFTGVDWLDWWPTVLRPLAAKFSLACQRVRGDLAEARRILAAFVAERRAQRARGEKREDLLQWFEDGANGAPYDPALLLLRASLAALHTTSDLLTQTLFNLCSRPDLVTDLRKEAAAVLGKHGLQKNAVYELKLMDSVIKESQRLKPLLLTSFSRITVADVTLSDGLEIPKGTPIQVSNRNMWDPAVSEYTDADKFDGYRFYNLRRLPGYENTGQLVTTSPSHTGFGLGKHACPGRFFAAIAMKLILCHILLKYDIRLAEGQVPKPVYRADTQIVDPVCEILVRRRKMEIDLAKLAESIE